MVVFVISGCATTSNQPAAVERMYVISCGENHVKDLARSVQTMQEVETFMQRSGAKLWINHDMAQNASIPKAPAFVE